MVIWACDCVQYIQTYVHMYIIAHFTCLQDFSLVKGEKSWIYFLFFKVEYFLLPILECVLLHFKHILWTFYRKYVFIGPFNWVSWLYPVRDSFVCRPGLQHWQQSTEAITFYYYKETMSVFYVTFLIN